MGWPHVTLLLILLALAAFLALAVRRAMTEPWPEASMAGYIAVGCAVAAAVALAIGLLVLHRRRRR